MHSQVHVIKEADGTIDPEYLKMVLEKFPSCSGVAVSFGGDEPMEVQTNRGPADLNTLMAAQKEYQDKKLYFSFGNHPEGFPDDEMQPYTLLKDPNNEDLVVAFIDGEYPEFAKTDSSYSSAFHFAHDWLQKEIHKLYIEVEGDISEFMKRLNSPSMKKEMAKHANPRGSVTILTYDTPAITYNKNDIFGDYSDFWTSNALDYDEEIETRPAPEPEKKEEPPIPVVPKKRPSLLAKSDGTAPAKPDVAPAEPSKKAPGTGPQPAPSEEKILMRCPMNITKWADVRKWYETAIGTVPGNYKERPEVPVLKSKITNTRTLQDLADKVTIASTDPVKMPAKPTEVKPETLPISNPTEKMPTSSEFFHIIPPEEIKKFFKDFAVRNDIVSAVDDKGKTVILNQDKLDSAAKRWSTFSEQSKIELIDVVNWQDPALYILVKEHPRYAFKLIKDLLRAYAVSRLSSGTVVQETGATIVAKKKSA